MSLKSTLPPASCNSLPINILGVVCFFACWYLLRSVFHVRDYVEATIFALSVTAISLAIIDLFVFKIQKRPSTGLSITKPRNLKRVGIKLLGFYVTLGAVLFCYWLFPEYNGSFYNRYYRFLFYLAPFIIIGSWFYYVEVDRRMENPHDGYWQLGCLVLGKWKELNRVILGEHARVWIIKGFFLPLMFTYTVDKTEWFLTYNYEKITASFYSLYLFAFHFMYTLDLIYATLGYIMTFRLLDTHIRSAEPTLLGWIVALICYNPFWLGFITVFYIKYENSFYWNNWLNGYPVIYVLWGTLIILMLFIYSLATVCLGYRFSNLTWRGLITSGPYRFTKHPAYVAKCISWLLISIPFIISDSGIFPALRNTLLLCLLCFVYYLRARTEENHLSNYPEYVEYANWMNKHGIFRFIGDQIPYLRYSEKRCQAWGSVAWMKKIKSN